MKSDIPNGFDKPTTLPESSGRTTGWQDANRAWWEEHPMRYDWKHSIGFEEFSKLFFEEIDKRLFSDAREYMPYRRTPFDSLINFDALASKDVLEIGVGNGSHAQLLAQHAKSYTGIDITSYAVKSTSQRLECFQLDATIVRMDAERMHFSDNTFDFIWTWGVIHHSANTARILQEMRRVLRPGGTAVCMVYHRNVWNYYVMCGLFRGIIQGDLFRTRSLHKTAQRFTDGALARYYTPREWKSLASKFFVVKRMQVYGSKAELIPLPGGTVKCWVLRAIPNAVGRFFTNKLRLGAFLVSTLERAP